MSESIEIKLLSFDSVDDQLKIHRAAFGEGNDSLIDRDHWIKKHYENPVGQSLIFGAVINEKIVGMNAYMPMEYMYSGEKHLLLQSCESGVLPECQGRGIWSKIVRFALQYITSNTPYVAVIGFPNYTNSYPGFKKMGWFTINDMENYVMVNNNQTFSDIIGTDRFLLKRLSLLISAQRLFVPSSKDFIVTPCDYDDLIWDECNSVHRAHSKELINWKMEYLGSRLLSVRKNNEIVASCIFHTDKYNDGTIIKMECLSNNNSVSKRKALAAVLNYFHKSYPDAAFVRIWSTPKDSLGKVLNRMMFVKSNHKNPFIISNQTTLLFDKDWNLSFFDLD